MLHRNMYIQCRISELLHVTVYMHNISLDQNLGLFCIWNYTCSNEFPNHMRSNVLFTSNIYCTKFWFWINFVFFVNFTNQYMKEYFWCWSSNPNDVITSVVLPLSYFYMGTKCIHLTEWWIMLSGRLHIAYLLYMINSSHTSGFTFSKLCAVAMETLIQKMCM
jgi:hypothetical protein